MDSDALVDHLFESALGAFDMLTIYIGDQLGLYAALRDHGPLTPDGLAEHAAVHPRYAKEWLEQQTVAGLLEARRALPASAVVLAPRSTPRCSPTPRAWPTSRRSCG